MNDQLYPTTPFSDERSSSLKLQRYLPGKTFYRTPYSIFNEFNYKFLQSFVFLRYGSTQEQSLATEIETTEHFSWLKLSQHSNNYSI